MRKFIAILFIGVLSGNVRAQEKKIHVSPSSEFVRFTGRIKQDVDSVTLYWSATSIVTHFKGTNVNALLKDERGENYFNVVVDGNFVNYIKLTKEKKYYSIASNLPNREHTVELIKRNEWDRGKTWFYGLDVIGEMKPLPPRTKRVIEFFGNSITAGYAIEDYSGGDSPDGINTNNYYTYAAITARHYQADLYCTVKSGIGIMLSWFPLIMPELYNRLDPDDSLSRWNFKNVSPQIVVINLFQNDSWLVLKPEHESFKQRFGTNAPDEKAIIEAYGSFVKKIRDVYPSAHIICALGCMDATRAGSPWPGYVEKAVLALHDKKIYTHFFPFANKFSHPRKEENAAMAESLIKFIDQNISW